MRRVPNRSLSPRLQLGYGHLIQRFEWSPPKYGRRSYSSSQKLPLSLPLVTTGSNLHRNYQESGLQTANIVIQSFGLSLDFF